MKQKIEMRTAQRGGLVIHPTMQIQPNIRLNASNNRSDVAQWQGGEWWRLISLI
jgi:hypothetical protein